MTEVAVPTTKAEAIEAERKDAQERKENLQAELSALEDYIGWLDQGVELALRIDKPAELPPAASKPPPRKKRAARKAPAKTVPASSIKQEAYARRDRLEEWLNAHPGAHRPREVREALGYERQQQLIADVAGLAKEGRAVVSGTGRGATYSSAEGKADAGEPSAADPGLQVGRQGSAGPPREPEESDEAKARMAANKTKGEEARDRVREFVLANPNCSAADVTKALRIPKPRVLNNLNALKKLGQIHGSLDTPIRYRAAEHGAMATDHRGAKTRQERELLDALEKGYDTSDQLAIFLRRPEPQVRAALIALVRRQVLHVDAGRYSLSEDGGPNTGPVASGDQSTRHEDGIHDEMAEAGLV